MRKRKPGVKVAKRQLGNAVKAQKKANTRVRVATADLCAAEKRAKARGRK